MAKLSAFDRWISAQPEPADPPPEEATYNEPEPCPVCEWVGCHEDGCVLGE